MTPKWITPLRFIALRFTALLLIFLAVGMLAVPAFAQQEAPVAQNNAPAGIGILVLLLGLAAIGMVGASTISRRAPGTTGLAADIEPDDELIRDDQLQ